MGEVLAFGLPMLRARRKPTSGFCEVTVLPTRADDDRDTKTPPKPAKRRTVRKPSGASRPAGVRLK